MPILNISLTAEQEAFVTQMVASGRYQNASEAIGDALRGLQQRIRQDELRTKHLRNQIRTGAEAIARGNYTEVADADLETFIAALAKAPALTARYRLFASATTAVWRQKRRVSAIAAPTRASMNPAQIPAGPIPPQWASIQPSGRATGQ